VPVQPEEKKRNCWSREKGLGVALEHGISPHTNLSRQRNIRYGEQDSGEEKEGVNVNARANL
jgi:hypothetical protein